jgi:hypothetical protein
MSGDETMALPANGVEIMTKAMRDKEAANAETECSGYGFLIDSYNATCDALEAQRDAASAKLGSMGATGLGGGTLLECVEKVAQHHAAAMAAMKHQRDRAVAIRHDYECAECGGQVFDASGDACECAPNPEPRGGVGVAGAVFQIVVDEREALRRERDSLRDRLANLGWHQENANKVVADSLRFERERDALRKQVASLTKRLGDNDLVLRFEGCGELHPWHVVTFDGTDVEYVVQWVDGDGDGHARIVDVSGVEALRHCPWCSAVDTCGPSGLWIRHIEGQAPKVPSATVVAAALDVRGAGGRRVEPLDIRPAAMLERLRLREMGLDTGPEPAEPEPPETLDDIAEAIANDEREFGAAPYHGEGPKGGAR